MPSLRSAATPLPGISWTQSRQPFRQFSRHFARSRRDALAYTMAFGVRPSYRICGAIDPGSIAIPRIPASNRRPGRGLGLEQARPGFQDCSTAKDGSQESRQVNRKPDTAGSDLLPCFAVLFSLRFTTTQYKSQHYDNVGRS